MATAAALVVAVGIYRVPQAQSDAAHQELLDALKVQDRILQDLAEATPPTVEPTGSPASAPMPTPASPTPEPKSASPAWTPVPVEDDVLTPEQRTAVEEQYGDRSIEAARKSAGSAEEVAAAARLAPPVVLTTVRVTPFGRWPVLWGPLPGSRRPPPRPPRLLGLAAMPRCTEPAAVDRPAERLHVTGNHILEGDGHVFTSNGISVFGGLQDGDGQSVWQPALRSSNAQIEVAGRYWHSNTVRIPVSEGNLFSGDTPEFGYNAKFLDALCSEVRLARKRAHGGRHRRPDRVSRLGGA